MSSPVRTTRKPRTSPSNTSLSPPDSPAVPKRRRSGLAIGRDGAAVFFEVTGLPPPAPTLLLCDGLGCDGYVWKYLQWALQEHYRIIHFHYRGHGRSPVPSDLSQIGLSDFVHDALAVLDTCECEQAVLLGHSMGVQVALEAYHQAKERVSGLVLICGSYGNPLRTFKGKETLAEILPLVRATVTRLPRLVGALWRHMLPTELSYLLAQKIEINGALIQREDFFPYLEGISRMDPRMFVAALSAAGQHNAREILPTVEVPTLIVAGRNDSFTPMALSEEMRGAIPGAELYIVEQGTHTAPIERPAEVTQVITDFLGRRVEGAAPPEAPGPDAAGAGSP